MKTLIQNFRQLILVGLISFLTTSQSVGQVVTRILSPDDQIQNYMPWYNPDDKIVDLKTPIVDLEAVLEDDERIGRELPRIGIKQEVQFNTSNGFLSQSGNFTTWRLDIGNDNAKSLKFKMSLKVVPDDFVLFFYNEEYNFLVGPIKSKNFKDGDYVSDYIPGNKVSIILFAPNDQIDYKEDDIQISEIYVGLETTYAFDSAFETSLPCNINVACDEGLGWDCQISSVCKIITGDGACTGSLMNNDCCDLTPYILTADHCLRDIFGGLNDFGSYTYRFNYQSPQCDPNEEPNPSQWIVFSGSQLRSNWNGTDFGLLELFEEGIEGISYAGWNREANPPTNEVTCIHHPAGDVKKIAVNTDGVGTQGNFWLIEQFEAGLVEPGSSGSPLFDENGLVIGDLSGGDLNLGCDGDHGLADNNTYGQLSVSWDGGGAANSRLRDWLGASTNPMDLECLEDYPTIIGPDALCTQPRTFTLINNMPCIKNVQWEVNASNLLASPSSGNGNTATIWAKPNVKGNATITFTLTSNGCDPIELEKDFWIGKPNFDLFYNGPTQPCFGDIVTVFALPIPNDQGLQIIDWQVTGCGQILSVPSGLANTVIIEAVNCVGWMRVCATAKNECGTHQICRNIYIKQCDGKEDGPLNPRSITAEGSSEKIEINVFPNPSNDYINVNCELCDLDTKMKVSVLSPDGKLIQFNSNDSNTSKIDMTQMLSGLYILKVDIGGKIYYKKIIKI